MIQFALNLILAMLWLFLSGGGTFARFLVGYVIGFVLLAVFQRVIPDSGYVRRTLAFGRFLAAFFREFLRSNFNIAVSVLSSRRESMYPDFVTYDVAGLTRVEILVLSHCITLTPGTTTVDISDNWETLVLHAFDARDPVAVRSGIDRGLRAPLLAFTR
ncbi:MAG TPA: Na+/H+ antiporter subunit E [Verrucomicrobiota bacterium]|nr:cation:proton antiporter [Verrucomicrobiales bacterium]HRI11862.1 Na+/H+ antiporter subunit E [Verrucomicrobiota bacterium]